VASLDGVRGRKLIDPGSASCGTLKTLVDAVAGGLDVREGQVYFSDDSGDIETSDISDTTPILGLVVEVGANLREATIVAFSNDTCEGA